MSFMLWQKVSFISAINEMRREAHPVNPMRPRFKSKTVKVERKREGKRWAKAATKKKYDEKFNERAKKKMKIEKK